MGAFNTGSKGVPSPMKVKGANQPGHGKSASTGHKMTMVSSKGRTITAGGKTGAANMGKGKFGNTGDLS